MRSRYMVKLLLKYNALVYTKLADSSVNMYIPAFAFVTSVHIQLPATTSSSA